MVMDDRDKIAYIKAYTSAYSVDYIKYWGPDDVIQEILSVIKGACSEGLKRDELNKINK